MESGPQELRCFCRREPLLAVIGQDDDGRWFLHVKVYKQSRIYGEIVATDGKVSVRCRECLRWHHVTIKHESVDSDVGELPEAVAREVL